MNDHSEKNWLRPTPSMFKRLLQVIGDMLMLAAFLGALAWIINSNEARAQGNPAILLENSMWPATFDECRRARPDLGRPLRVASKQQRTNEPWHHRICTWKE